MAFKLKRFRHVAVAISIVRISREIASRLRQVRAQQPGHADGQRRLVPRRAAQLSEFVEEAAGDVGMDPDRCRTTGRAERCASRSGPGRRRAARRRPGVPAPNSDRAAAMSRVAAHAAGTHVPAVGGVQITGGLQMFGDQRGVLVGRCRVT